MIDWTRSALLAALCLGTVSAASAQNWPARPITIVVPAAPGGVTDALGRVREIFG